MVETTELSLADRAVAFIESLTLVDDYEGEPFVLRPWQEDFVRRLFATDEDGKRIARKVFLALPRKQAKTTLWAAIILFLLFGTGKRGQKIYSASGSREQASLIFDIACDMINASDELSEVAVIYPGYKRIEFPALNSSFEALASDANLKHGLNPSVVIFDEVHVFPNRKLHDVLTSGSATRREPLTAYITTAGENKHSFCYELWQYALAVRDGKIDNPRFLPVIYAADPAVDDWTDEAVWHRVMPALGDFCSIDEIRDKLAEAQSMPSGESHFKQVYLNLWVDASHDRWLSLDQWDACRVDFDPAAYAGRRCYAGLDLSLRGDLTALVLIFPEEDGTLTLLPHFWSTAEAIREKEDKDGVPYLAWARQGWITLCDGEDINFDEVQRHIIDLAEVYEFEMLTADPWQLPALGQRLQRAGINVQSHSQATAAMTVPAHEFEKRIRTGKLKHNGNPVMSWHIENVVAHKDVNGNIRPSKDKSRSRIDGVSAAVTALAGLVSTEGDLAEESVYANRGVLVI